MSGSKGFTKGFRFLLSIGLVVWLAACSTSGTYRMDHWVENKPIKGTSVLLSVQPRHPGEQHTAFQLEHELGVKLLSSGLFKKITREKESDSEYEIAIEITEVKSIDSSERILLGQLAGSNKIYGYAKVIDRKSQNTVRSFYFGGNSASHPYSGKAEFRHAIEEAAKQFIKALG